MILFTQGYFRNVKVRPSPYKRRLTSICKVGRLLRNTVIKFLLFYLLSLVRFEWSSHCSRLASLHHNRHLVWNNIVDLFTKSSSTFWHFRISLCNCFATALWFVRLSYIIGFSEKILMQIYAVSLIFSLVFKGAI